MASSTQSLWNSENIKDVAEAVGLSALPEDILDELARDVDYRVAQVLEEALKFMRHGKRTTMTTQDVSNALKVLNVEPLYGYESTRPLRFGEASVGRGQTLYYVEDEEVDFEKMINHALPKVPREITFTGAPLPGSYAAFGSVLLTMPSTLARCGRRTTYHPPESYRHEPRGPVAQGPKCKPASGRCQRPGQCQRETARQTCAVQGVSRAVRQIVQRTHRRNKLRVAERCARFHQVGPWHPPVDNIPHHLYCRESHTLHEESLHSSADDACYGFAHAKPCYISGSVYRVYGPACADMLHGQASRSFTITADGLERILRDAEWEHQRQFEQIDGAFSTTRPRCIHIEPDVQAVLFIKPGIETTNRTDMSEAIYGPQQAVWHSLWRAPGPGNDYR